MLLLPGKSCIPLAKPVVLYISLHPSLQQLLRTLVVGDVALDQFTLAAHLILVVVQPCLDLLRFGLQVLYSTLLLMRSRVSRAMAYHPIRPQHREHMGKVPPLSISAFRNFT